MGIFGKKEKTVAPVKTPVTFTEQLDAIKETFKTAYQRAENLSSTIEKDIVDKTTKIASLQSQLNASENAMTETQKFMKNLEKFI